MGGSIASYVMHGDVVELAVLGGNVVPHNGELPAERRYQIHGCAQQAKDVLGISRLSIDCYPGNQFDTVPMLKLVKTVETWIEAAAPDLVFTHHAGDLNIDHQRTHQAVMTALRPMKGHSVRQVATFEVPSATEWGFSQFKAFTPNLFISITGDCLQRKLDALACYDTEMREFPHPRSKEAITALAQYRGSHVGVEAAEAFQIVWRTGIF